MKIIIIGSTGTIGKAIVKELKPRHQIISVGHSSGDFQCDITSEASIKKLVESHKPFDALVVAAGEVHFEELMKMNAAKYQKGLNHKLMGQVNAVLIGCNYIADNGSFTLTSGILGHDPIVAGSSAAMVNGAIESFVRAAAIEMPRGIRINAVSPTILTESVPDYESFFRGFEPVPAARVALAYSKSVEGHQTGQIYRVGYST